MDIEKLEAFLNKNERPTKCIVHSTLRDATTPYIERCV